MIWAFLAALLVGAICAVVGFRIGRGRVPVPAQVDKPARTEQPSSRTRAVHIERALADLRLGVIIVDGGGAEVYRNNVAQQFATGRHGNAIAEAALKRMVEGALLGLSLEEEVEIYGPPARNLLVQASPTYERGRLNGAVGVIDDVTEARHVDRVRRDFIANVSHELRTPIGAMSVLAETLVEADDPDVVERLAERVQREAHRLGDTIADLLSLSRLESGPIHEPETMDLQSVVAMAVERTAEVAAGRDVTISVENLAEEPLFVDGDQAQLVSAVGNLIDNAVKYSEDGAAVEILLARSADSGEVVLNVVDAGIGIPERDLARIFERFYRVDSARSRETGGTGLGLSIVRHAVLNHRGSIEVSSTEGVGTTFEVRLPMSPAQEQLPSELAHNGGTTDQPGTR